MPHGTGGPERDVQKGEDVVWIVHQRGEGAEAAWTGVEALPDTPENRKAVIEAVEKEAAWGPVSNGLQCRLLPQRQEVTPHSMPRSAEEAKLHVTYEIRNVSQRSVKFRPYYYLLEGVWAQVVEVKNPDGTRRKCYPPADGGSPLQDQDRYAVIEPGRTFSRRVPLPYDFSNLGRYELSITTRHPEIILDLYYGGDAEEARENPDNVWTGELKSNRVTVAIIRPRAP